jgi:molybdate transport system substrate-binding protein
MRRSRRLSKALTLFIAPIAVIVTGCGDDDASGSGETGGATTSAEALQGEIVVFAAASLTDAFTEIGEAFHDANPAASVTFNFGPSSGLETQIEEGAPADVFASADQNNMQKAVDDGAITGEPEVFARNRLAIVVPAGNPGGVDALEDFADDRLLIGLCAEEVPCGRFGREALANAGVEPAIDTNEPDVRALLTKVESGDLDAGIVYVTDVRAAGDSVEGIEIPADVNVEATYPIGALVESGTADVADAFIAYVLSADGQAILAAHGFLGP